MQTTKPLPAILGGCGRTVASEVAVARYRVGALLKSLAPRAAEQALPVASTMPISHG